jgi:hypothetical protein
VSKSKKNLDLNKAHVYATANKHTVFVFCETR